MESKRRELLKKMSMGVGFLATLKFLPACQTSNGQKSIDSTPVSIGVLSSGIDIDKDYYLPKNPELYQVVSGIRVKRLFLGNLPKIFGNGQMLFGDMEYITCKRGHTYTFQYLGPFMGWTVI